MTARFLSFLLACAEPPGEGAPGDPSAPVASELLRGVEVVGTGHPLMWTLRASVSRPARLEVTCTSPVEPEESLRFSSPEPEVVALGLLADTPYTCAVTAIDADGAEMAGEVAFTTGSLPDTLPAVAVADDDGSNQDYILYNTRKPLTFVVVDRDGRVRWFQELSGDEAEGDIGIELAWLPDRQELLACGGSALDPRRELLSGEETWRAPPPRWTEGVYHHDCRLLDDGGVVALETDPVVWDGVDLKGAAIREYGPDGDLRWEWTTQHGMDTGALWVGAFGPGIDMDPWHANALGWMDDPQGPAAYLSNFDLGQVVRIDRDTGLVTWTLGPDGDFEVLDADGRPAGADAWFDGQHGIDWWTDADGLHALVYDNGLSKKRSRVLEYAIDPEARTATLVWAFVEPEWYTPLWGDADRLPDGQVLVVKGHCQECSGVLGAGRSEIVLVDPEAGTTPWRIRFAAAGDAVYRAQRIGACELFANARFCEDLTDR
jgi:hypothetical protein